LAVLGPLAVLFRLLGGGRVSDLDLTRREERPIPLLASLCGASVAAGALSLIHAPDGLRGLAMAQAAVVGAVLLVNPYWKVSLHTAGATGVAIIVGALSGWGGIAILPALLVGWARIRLGRHSVAQVVAGGLLGGMLYLLLAAPR
jgi:membrane-associated phospholipid phosphatase